MLEKVRLRSSELTSCEWCSVRKLPVLFFQTSDSECQRLRTQLQMSQESGGLWYDCSGESERLNSATCRASWIHWIVLEAGSSLRTSFFYFYSKLFLFILIVVKFKRKSLSKE